MGRVKRERNPADQVVGERVRILRTDRRMSQEALAEAADVEVMAISRIETGKTVPSIPTARALARALGVPVSRLIDVDLPVAGVPSENDILALWGRLDAEDRRTLVLIAQRLASG